MSIDGDWKILMRALSIQAQAVSFSKGTTQQEKDAIADYMIGIADMIEAYPVPQYIRSISEAQEHCLGRLKAAELQIATEKTQYGCLKIQEQAALKERDNALLQIREVEDAWAKYNFGEYEIPQLLVVLMNAFPNIKRQGPANQAVAGSVGSLRCALCGEDVHDNECRTKKRDDETERLIVEERRLGAEVRCDCGVPGCNKLYDHRK